MKFHKLILPIGMALAAQSVFAADLGTALRADVIKKEPFSDAKTLGRLTVGDKVSIFAKDGGWLKVQSAKGSGWVRMLSIRRGAAKKSDDLADNLRGLSSGRAGTGKIVATTGIRGLNEEELRSAKFDEGELSRVESFATSRIEAQNFAEQGQLKSRSLVYLALPK